MELPDSLFDYKGEIYPKFQTTGNSARFILPFALEFCKGYGIDFGYGNPEWKLPGAIGVEKGDNLKFYGELDYIFSSHCLEHVDSWVDTVKTFSDLLKSKGVLFLYLPHYSQVYWRPWNNSKHKHIIEQDHLVGLLKHLDFNNIITSGVDINNSYCVIGFKS